MGSNQCHCRSSDCLFVIWNLQTSELSSGVVLSEECSRAWTMVWFWSYQWSLLSGKDWPQPESTAVYIHMRFRAHFSLIRGYFDLKCSYQIIIWSEMVWPEVTSIWQLNLGCEIYNYEGSQMLSSACKFGKNCDMKFIMHLNDRHIENFAAHLECVCS